MKMGLLRGAHDGNGLSSSARRALRCAAAICAIALLSCGARAQLVPEMVYYGIGRTVPMTVEVPGGVEGEPEVHLLRAGTGEVVERASVAAGRVDMAALFPVLWKAEEPELLYAQLVVGEEPVGPAVVLEPMTTPRHAPIADRAGVPVFAPRRSVVYSGVRAYVDKHVELDTTEGRIVIALRPDAAPNTVWHFRQLVDGGFYRDVVFHRVVPQNPDGHPYLVQTGDPTGTGRGDAGFYIDLEPSTLEHDFGVLSMARGSDPNSNSSQFFICLSREGTRALDGLYTSFGVVVEGGEVLERIAATPVDQRDRPIDPPRIRSAALVDAPPYGEGPEPARPSSQRPAKR